MQTRRVGGMKAALGVSTLVAVALMAMVPAFACGPRATAQIEPARGEAGTTVNVTGSLFKPEYSLVVKWGGASGVVLATSAVRADGTVGPIPVTIPATAEPGKIAILAIYQPDDHGATVSNVTFEVAGVPAPAVTPVQPAPEPTPSPAPAPDASATPAPAAAPAQTSQPAAAPAPASRVRVQPAPVAAAAPVPAPPAAEPAPPPEAQVASDTPWAEEPPVAAGPPAARTAPAPAATGAGSIDGGTSLWVLVPLVGLGLTLFAASAAIVVHELRKRRSTVEA